MNIHAVFPAYETISHVATVLELIAIKTVFTVAALKYIIAIHITVLLPAQLLDGML